MLSRTLRRGRGTPGTRGTLHTQGPLLGIPRTPLPPARVTRRGPHSRREGRPRPQPTAPRDPAAATAPPYSRPRARAHVTPPPPPPERAPLRPAASSPGGPAARRRRRRPCEFPGRPRLGAAKGRRTTLHPGPRRLGPLRLAGPVEGLPRRPRTPRPRRRSAAARAGVLPCCSPTWRGGAGPGAAAEAEEVEAAAAAAAAAQRGNKASLHTAAEHSGNPAAGKTMVGGRDAPPPAAVTDGRTEPIGSSRRSPDTNQGLCDQATNRSAAEGTG